MALAGLLRARRERPDGCRAAEQRVMNARRLMQNIGVSNRLAPPSVGLPHAQPTSEPSLGPWGRPELF